MIVEHEGTKNVRGMIRKYWSIIPLIIIAFVTLIYLVLLFGFHSWGPEDQLMGRFYWFYVNAEPQSSTSIVLTLIVVVALISLVLWFILNVKHYVKHWLGCSSLLFALFLFCSLSYFSLIFLFSSDTRHLDEVRQQDEIYRLAYWDSIYDWDYYVLFRCDSIGIICSEICKTRVENDNIAIRQPKIFIDGSPQVVSIMDNGQRLCSSEAQS